jgi:hypothetical protein
MPLTLLGKLFCEKLKIISAALVSAISSIFELSAALAKRI